MLFFSEVNTMFSRRDNRTPGWHITSDGNFSPLQLITASHIRAWFALKDGAPLPRHHLLKIFDPPPTRKSGNIRTNDNQFNTARGSGPSLYYPVAVDEKGILQITSEEYFDGCFQNVTTGTHEQNYQQ